MELGYFIFIIFLLFSLTMLGIMFFMFKSLKSSQDRSELDYLKSDLNNLSQSVESMRESLTSSIDRNNSVMNQSLQRQLVQSSRLVEDVTAKLAKLDETNRRVVDVADELKTLQNVLSNPKQRGVFGEFYLKNVLENILPPGQFQMQYGFKNGEIVDAAIFLEKGQILPIDSKFSLENYNRMIESKDKTEKERLAAKVRSDLKMRIDETSKYIRRDENTMDFAFMFIPSEALYYDLLIGSVGSGASSRDLIEYAFRDKRVIIVSPTSFMAYLQTVLQGLRSLQIEEQAKDIRIRVGQLGVHIGRFEQYMQKLGNTLGTTVNHFNNAHKELGKVDKDVLKITGSSPGVEPQLIDRPQKDE